MTNCSYDALDRLTMQSSPFEGGAVSVTKYRYDANGNVIATETNSSVPGGVEKWRSTGSSYDSRGRLMETRSWNGEDWEYTDETGTYYLRARYYASRLGRFTSKNILLLVALFICLLTGGCTGVDLTSEDDAALSDGYVSTLSVGSFNVFAVDQESKLWGWGQNKHNVLQIEAEEALYPVEVLDSVKSVSVGEGFVLVVREDDTLWGWGWNHYGQLGLGTNTIAENMPAKIMDDVVEVSVGGGFSVVLKKDGTLWVSGHNACGVLGTGTYSHWALSESGDGDDEYERINNNSNEFIKVMDNVRSFHAGGGNIVAVDCDNYLWAWGDNQIQAIDSPTCNIVDDADQPIVYTPHKLMESVRSARIGAAYLYILKLDGELIKWQSPSTQETILNNVKYIDVNCLVLAVITNDDSLLCWNLPYTEENAEGFCRLDENVAYVSAGDRFVSYIDKQNDLYCAGLKFDGLVGNGENTFDPTLLLPPGAEDSTLLLPPGAEYPTTEDDFVYPPVKVLSNMAVGFKIVDVEFKTIPAIFNRRCA